MTAHTNPVFIPDEPDACKENFRTDISESPPKGHREIFSIDLESAARQKEDEAATEIYDPYKHRKVEHPTSNTDTLIHLLKGCLGTGILAMPKAFSHSGYVLGVAGTVIIGFICTYSIHTLIRCEYELCKRRRCPSMTYPALAEAAVSDGPKSFRKFAPFSLHVVNVFIMLYQIGTCSVYIVFIAANMRSVANNYFQDIGIELYMLMILLPLIVINWIRNLKSLAPLSVVANFVTFISFGIIIYLIFKTGPTFENKYAVGHAENMPLFFGTVLFALEAIGVMLPLENEMKDPKAFGKPTGVLNIAMTTIICLYLGLGMLGYLAFGDEVQGSITLSLADHDVLAQVVQGSLAAAIFISYGLQYYAAFDITWNQYVGPRLEKNSHQMAWEYVVRTCIVIFTCMLAAAVPKLDLFISLIGAFCLAAVGIAIPAFLDMCCNWYYRSGNAFYFMVCKNAFLLTFSVLGLIAGTYTSVRDIVGEFS